jgi:glutathione S-transferase
MKLYWGSGSPVSWRIQLALAFKGVDYESHRLDLGNREHRGDAYRAINPKGTFPFLVDGEITVRDSLAIVAYLDRRDPSPPLFGDTLGQAASIWQLVAEHDSGLGAHTEVITRAVFRDGGLDGDLEPILDAIEGAHQRIEDVSATLGQGDWMVGDKPSAAEIVLYPTMHRILRAAAKPEAGKVGLDTAAFKTRHPIVTSWLERLRVRPGVDATYPPHWRA